MSLTLFLTPDQFDFHKYYKAAHIKIYEYEMATLCKVQRRYLELLRHGDEGGGNASETKLRRSGKEAYFAYLSAYASHKYNDIYDMRRLDVGKVAMCFGFDRPPGSKTNVDDRVIQHPHLSPQCRERQSRMKIRQTGGRGGTNNNAPMKKLSSCREG